MGTKTVELLKVSLLKVIKLKEITLNQLEGSFCHPVQWAHNLGGNEESYIFCICQLWPETYPTAFGIRVGLKIVVTTMFNSVH